MSHNSLSHLDVAIFSTTVAEEAGETLENPYSMTGAVLQAIFEDDMPEEVELSICSGKYAEGLHWAIDTTNGVVALVFPGVGKFQNDEDIPELFNWIPEE